MTEHEVRTRVWRNGTVEAENFPFEQISDYLEQPDCLVWVDLCAPDHARLQSLAEELSLDPHAVEDAVEHRERPKASRYATHMFLAAYEIRLDRETGELHTSQVSAFVVKRAFVTVRQSEYFDMDPVVTTWDENADLMKYGPKALVHGLLDVLVDGHFTAIEALDDETEKIEDILFEETRTTVRQVQIRSFALRKSLVEARRVILPMRELVSAVMRRADDTHPDLEPYYDDLYDHVLRAAEWTESLRDMISSIFETNLSLADSRLNSIMKKLTGWAAIIAVPTAVTGFYGQNVPYPGFGAHWGFWVSTLVMIAMSVGLYAIFRRKDWI
ncbi:MAG TPA: magnesium transporter CorA family protein [Jatrophihabitantaceae bacterium]